MDDIGVFTPEQARQLWQWYQTSKQHQPHIQSNYPQRRPIDEPSPHRVFVLNTEEEVIPPYACLRITGVEIVGGQTCIKVEKPSSVEGEFLFNCQFEIPVASGSSAGVGWAYRYGVVVMLGNGVSPTAENVEYTPVVDSWEIEQGAGPFLVFGEHNVGDDTLIGRFSSGGAVEYAVILDDALAVATNSKTGATSCLATVCVWDASINDYVETATQKTVWNHSESTEYAIDTFGSARTIDGHLWFFGDCAPMASR